MRLVDDEERHGQRGEHVDERVVFEFLRRHEDDLHLARGDPRDGRRFLLFGKRRIERGHRLHAAVVQHVDLIFHQRDERAHDDRRTRQDQGGKLIAQRFAGPGRKDRKRILALHDARNDFLLSGLEVVEMKEVAQSGAQVW